MKSEHQAPEIREQVRRITASPLLSGSDRLCRFLEFITEKAIEGDAGALKESVIAIEVFGRDASYDPRTDSVVRVSAGKLRSKLAEYYAREGASDPLRIELPRGGYAPVFELAAAEAVPPAPVRRLPLWSWAALGALGIVALAVGAGSIWRMRLSAGPAASVAVLPFVSFSTEPGDELFADGLTEEIIDSLAQIRSLRVVARTSAFQFKGKDRDIREIGQKLQVGAVVEGSLRRSENHMRITAQLNKTEDGYHLWSHSYDVELKDVIGVQQEIARNVVLALSPKLEPSVDAIPKKQIPAAPEVYELNLEGRANADLRTHQGYERAIERLQRAIGKDPQYAPAYSNLAHTYFLQGEQIGILSPAETIVKVRGALDKALEIDPNLWEAHVTLGRLKAGYEWDWAGAEREFRRAIQSNPGHEIPHRRFGSFLSNMGRHDEAVGELEKAVSLDPLANGAQAVLARALGMAKRYDEAIGVCERTLALRPHNWVIYQNLGLPYWGKGEFGKAAEATRKAIEFGGDEANLYLQAYLANALALSGDAAGARAILDRMLSESAKRYVPPPLIAVVYVALKENDRAFEFLDQGLRVRDPLMVELKADPRWQGLNRDPRYAALLKRIGL